MFHQLQLVIPINCKKKFVNCFESLLFSINILIQKPFTYAAVCYSASKSNQQRKVPIENICSGGPYEEYEHWGDGDVTEKGNEIVLDNLKKKPY